MYDRILVPIDGGPVAVAGLDEAIRVARCCNATLRLLHVLDTTDHANGFETPAVYRDQVVPRAQAGAHRILEQARQRAVACGLSCETRLVETLAASASDVVVEQAASWPADLIVLGTHGRHGVDRLLLGSHAEQVVRGASVPVLLVRSQSDE